MSGSKHFDRIAVIVMALMLVLTILFMNGAALGIEAMAHTMGYENRLFDNTKVHSVDIVMDDWDEFIANATSEEYYMASVVIDGESYKNIGLRAKGNTSLSMVSSLGSERYSFKIEFDHYDSTRTYHGLDKLSLNNLIQDSTMMKDYLTYTMMNGFGVNSSLCSYVYITVNGEDWGCTWRWRVWRNPSWSAITVRITANFISRTVWVSAEAGAMAGILTRLPCLAAVMAGTALILEEQIQIQGNPAYLPADLVRLPCLAVGCLIFLFPGAAGLEWAPPM